METADRTLWTSWRARRDEGAFETLVRPHLGFAVDLARRMGCSAADADDVVQEALVRLAREEGERPVEVGLRAWIGRVVSLRSRMLRRESARRRRRERAVLERPAGTESPSRVAGDAPPTELGAAVEEALAALPEPQREAVTLHHLHDLDYASAAHVLGISENACRIRVHRGVERLRARLGAKAPAALAALPLASPPAHPEAFVASALGQAATPGFVLGSLGALGGVLAVKQVVLLGVAAAAVVAAGYVASRVLDPGTPRRDAIEGEIAAAESGGGPALAAAEPRPAAPPAVPAAEPAPAPSPRAEPTPHAALVGAIYASGGRVGVLRRARPGDAGRVEWFETADAVPADAEVAAVESGRQGTGAWMSQLGRWPSLASLRIVGAKDLDLSLLPTLPELLDLTLDKMLVTPAVAGLLARQPRLASLEVRDARLDEETLRAIAALPLTSFALDGTTSPDGALAAIAGMTRLRTVKVEDPALADAGLAPFATLSALERLDLSRTRVTGKGFVGLAGLSSLRRLTLEKARVDDEGLKAIAALPALDTLDLEETDVTDAGMPHLAGTRLVDLTLSNTRITDAAFESLAKIATLRKVDVGDTKVTAEGIARFKALRPDVRVRD